MSHIAGLLGLTVAMGCSDDDGSQDPGDAGTLTADANVSAEASGPDAASSGTQGSSTTFESSDTSDSSRTSTAPISTLTDSTASSETAPGFTGAEAGVDGTSSADESSPSPPSVCSNLPAIPVSAQDTFVLPYHAQWYRDFAFDSQGNLITNGYDDSLVRVTRSGTIQVVTRDLGLLRGVTILKDDSVLATVEPGFGPTYLVRVHPDGRKQTLVTGLEGATGVVQGADDHAYVAETDSGRLLRVNIATGEFTILVKGLEQPYHVALSPDPNLLYVGSYEGEGIYKITLNPEAPAQVEIFATSPISPLALPAPLCDEVVGAPCSLPNGVEGECRKVGEVVDCFRLDACAESTDGEACNFPLRGLCKAGKCLDSCEALALGAECTYGSKVGICVEDAVGSPLRCEVPLPCAGKSVGEVCDVGEGYEGVCDDLESTEFLTCRERNDCDDLGAGAECESWGDPGVCSEMFGAGYLTCDTNPCTPLAVGDECILPPGYAFAEGVGVCFGDDSYRYCELTDPCAGLNAGAECETLDGPGLCENDGYGGVTCNLSPCAESTEGDVCMVGYDTMGTCEAGTNGLVCELPPACAELALGETCYERGPGNILTDGVCVADDGGLRCEPVKHCEGLSSGAACRTSLDSGQCVESDDGLVCREACYGRAPFDNCDHSQGRGRCLGSGDGRGLVCTEAEPEPCDLEPLGSACTLDGAPGTCLFFTDLQQFGGGMLECMPASCAGRDDGARCTLDVGASGRCHEGECIAVVGNVYGLGADVCGNVYASDMATGNVWRVSATGELQLLSNLVEASSLRSLHWGTGAGGFSVNTLYVRDWVSATLYGIPVGAPPVSHVTEE